MNKLFFAVTAAFAVFVSACGSPEMNTSMTCTQNYSCQNNVCTCSDAPKMGSSCCSPSDTSCTTNKCDEFCKVCK